ncbi:hypothetical protein DL98DRAFT_613342 [Cadophora sp. DSE1049]|nr:hypothetical protein DL98DRAFT_613342 [Cadophora sp. DSE1049]
MTDMTSSTNSQSLNPGSAKSRPPRGQFPPLEAAPATSVPKNRPNRIILPPKSQRSPTNRIYKYANTLNNQSTSPTRREGVSAMDFLVNTRSAPYRSPQISSEDREQEILDEDVTSPIPSPTIISEPAVTMPPPDGRSDSGFAEEGSQQQTQNGMNRPNVITVDTHIDDNLSTIYTNNTNTNTFTYSDSGSVADTEPQPKCFQNLHRFLKSKPLQRLSHNIEVWKWERSQEKSIKYQDHLQQKAVKKAQAAHVNFERDQARRAKEYVKNMRKREREGRVRYRGSQGKREAVGDWLWWVGRGRRKVNGEKREWEGGLRWADLRERHRMLREGDGTFTTVVRTSEEVAAEERWRSAHARD